MTKNRNFKIHIEEPCRVSKENFTRTTHGFFCASCQKCVVDYTQYSDQELARSMSRPQVSSCGIFTKEQLDKVYQEKPQPQTKARSLPALLLSGLFLTGHSLQAQEEPLVDSTNVVKATEDTLLHEALEATTDTLAVDDSVDTTDIVLEIDSQYLTKEYDYVLGNSVIMGDVVSCKYPGFFVINREETALPPIFGSINEIVRNPIDTVKKVVDAIRNKPKPVSDEPKDSVPKEKPLAWLSNLISKRFKKDHEDEGGTV